MSKSSKKKVQFDASKLLKVMSIGAGHAGGQVLISLEVENSEGKVDSVSLVFSPYDAVIVASNILHHAIKASDEADALENMATGHLPN
jgi:hypothetical protein